MRVELIGDLQRFLDDFAGSSWLELLLQFRGGLVFACIFPMFVAVLYLLFIESWN